MLYALKWHHLPRREDWIRGQYYEKFEYYKQFILENFEFPGIAAIFAWLNFEILGSLPPALDLTHNN